jgi:RES domain
VVKSRVDAPTTKIQWPEAVRIIRSIYPPIDLFEDLADPSDWALLISAEQKTNPRLMETLGNLDLVPIKRRVGGVNASLLMAPFTHVSRDRKSRFSDGTYGVLYVGDRYEVALFETIYHHARFMARTTEKPGWTSQFRAVIMTIIGTFHDLRAPSYDPLFQQSDYTECQRLGKSLRDEHSDGAVYPSQRFDGGQCVALFYPDLASDPLQGRHLDYHWNGIRVDLVRDAGSGEVFRVVEI